MKQSENNVNWRWSRLFVQALQKFCLGPHRVNWYVTFLAERFLNAGKHNATVFIWRSCPRGFYRNESLFGSIRFFTFLSLNYQPKFRTPLKFTADQMQRPYQKNLFLYLTPTLVSPKNCERTVSSTLLKKLPLSLFCSQTRPFSQFYCFPWARSNLDFNFFWMKLCLHALAKWKAGHDCSWDWLYFTELVVFTNLIDSSNVDKTTNDIIHGISRD